MKATSRRPPIRWIASFLALCAWGACSNDIATDAVGAGGAGGAGGASSSEGGAGPGANAASSSGSGAPGDAGVDGNDMDAAMPPACASDSAGRPLALRPGGDGYTLAPGERTETPGAFLARVAIGDVTGDGRADIIGGELEEAWVFPQNQDGSLGAPIIAPHGFGNPPSVALLKANADPMFDLVVTSWMGLEVLPALGGGAFGPGSFVATVHGFDIEIADINLDGYDDIVMPSSNGVILAYGDGAGSLVNAHLLTNSFGQTSYQIALGDVTGDARPDLVGVHYESPPKLLIVPHDGANGLSTTGWLTVDVPGDAIGGLDVGDVNADGLLDAVVQGDDDIDYDVRTRLLTGTANGLAPAVEIAKASYGGGVVIEDANADGRGDVALVHAAGFEIGLVLSTQAGMGPHMTFEVPTAASVASHALAVGDINCDGCPDVVTANVGGLVVFLGQGCGE